MQLLRTHDSLTYPPDILTMRAYPIPTNTIFIRFVQGNPCPLGMGGREDKWRAVSQLVLCDSTSLTFPYGKPFLGGTAKPLVNCSFEPLVSQVMFASTMLSVRYFPVSTGLTLVHLFNPLVLEQHAGVARAGRNLNAHR
jgi:hypothetical protein